MLCRGPGAGLGETQGPTILWERNETLKVLSQKQEGRERDSEAEEKPCERLNKGFYKGTQIPGESSLSLGHSGRGSLRIVIKLSGVIFKDLVANTGTQHRWRSEIPPATEGSVAHTRSPHKRL